MSHTKIAELKRHVEDQENVIKARQAALEADRVELERLEKEEKARLQPGDLVVYVGPSWVAPIGTVGTVQSTRQQSSDVNDLVIETDIVPTLRIGCLCKADYAADRAAIEKYLMTKANKEGFKVGALVENNHPIQELVVTFPTDKWTCSATVSRKRDDGKPFVFARYASGKIGGMATPISQLTLKPARPAITVTVKGTAYVADFDKNPGHVTFGCAVLGAAMLRAASEFIQTRGLVCYPGDRDVEAIQIGKGLFTEATLKAIVDELDRRAAK